MPAAPAEANRLTPYCRTAAKVISAAATVMIASKVFAHPLQDAHLGDVLARQQIVFDIGAKPPQIDRHGDVERDRRGPAENQDKGHQQRHARWQSPPEMENAPPAAPRRAPG